MTHKLRFFPILCLLAAVVLAACGVKTEPDHPNGKDFPRHYPTY